MEELKNLEIPKEIEEKNKEIINKVTKFKNSILKKHKKDIIAIEILPPRKEDPELVKRGLAQPIKKNQIDVLVVLDDSNSKIQPNYKLKDSISKDLIEKATQLDKDLFLEIMLVSELKESCFDGRWELLNLISMGLPIYDPYDWIAALKISEVHKAMVLKKFDKYITSYVAAGSLFRGEKSNDIDVYVIIDDTDVKRMTRPELKDKLRGMIISMGYEAAAITNVKKQFHIQVYILTDFWESVKDAHPVIFTLLRDGVPLYDRGVFTPWRLLLKMGRIRPSDEAIDMNMDLGMRLLDRSKKKLLAIAMEDLFYAALNPSQAALMLYGLNPTTPKETVKTMEDVFVKKEKILEKKHVDTLEKIRKFFKDIEHGKIKDVTALEIDNLIKETEVYLKRIEKLFNQIKKKREKESFTEIYSNAIKVTDDILDYTNYPGKDLVLNFRKYSKENGLDLKYPEELKRIINSKKNLSKLNKPEIDKLKREIRTYVSRMSEHYQWLRLADLNKLKIRFKYSKLSGEVYLLGDLAYIIPDVSSKEKEIQKAKITKKGLSKLEKSTQEEFEDSLSKTKIPSSLSLNTNIILDLKKIFGNDLEIIL